MFKELSFPSGIYFPLDLPSQFVLSNKPKTFTIANCENLRVGLFSENAHKASIVVCCCSITRFPLYIQRTNLKFPRGSP